MVLNQFGETLLTLKELVDMCSYGTTVRVENAFNGRKFIESVSKPYVDKGRVKKKGIDSRFENSSYVKYGNIPVMHIEPYLDNTMNLHRTNDTYVFTLRIKVSAYDFDIEKAKKGEYALNDDQKREFYEQ